MATAENVKQDMPPKNGYRPIHVDRVFPKPFLSSEYIYDNLINNIFIFNYLLYKRYVLKNLS